MTAVDITLKLSGPVLTGAPGPIVERAIADTVRELSELGVEWLAENLVAGNPFTYQSWGYTHGRIQPGNYRRNVHSEVSPTLGRINDSGVVYGPWLELGGGRFRGYQTFRRGADMLQGKAKDSLTRHVAEAVQELGG